MTIRALNEMQEYKLHAKKEAFKAREAAKVLAREARQAIQEFKTVEQNTALELLREGLGNRTSIFRTTSPEYGHGHCSALEREWMAEGVALAAQIKRMTKIKKRLLESYEMGEPVNINLGLNMENIEKYMK